MLFFKIIMFLSLCFIFSYKFLFLDCSNSNLDLVSNNLKFKFWNLSRSIVYSFILLVSELLVSLIES